MSILDFRSSGQGAANANPWELSGKAPVCPDYPWNPATIPGDGHPSSEANRILAEQLAIDLSLTGQPR